MSIVANVMSDVFSQVILTAFLFTMSPLVGATVLAVELIAVLVAQPMLAQARRNSDVRQRTIERLTDSVLEYVEGLAVVKSYNLTGEGAQDLRDSFATTRDTSLRFACEQSPFEAALLALYGLGSAAVLALSVWQLEQGAMTPDTFVGIALFLFQLFGPLRDLYQQSTRLTIMESALNRIESLFSQDELEDAGTDDLPDAAAAAALGSHEIEFSHVSFSYGEKKVLTDVSLAADCGQMVALVGQSGSGKTTLANLLARFWDVSAGQVLLRGVDVRRLPLSALMAQISMVFQNVYLFQDTVFNNIAMGRPGATREEVYEAARKACCLDFVMRMPYGFDTMVGEGGASLSGGEAQRVSIARAILKDAPIVVLDEATAFVDPENEQRMSLAIREIIAGKTVIVIAHKLRSIVGADKIIMLHRGRVLAEGTQGELLSSCPEYRALWDASEQVSGWTLRDGGRIDAQGAGVDAQGARGGEALSC